MRLRVIESPLVPMRVRTRILKAVGHTRGFAGVERGVQFLNPATSLGDGCYVNFGTVFEGRAPITVGDKVAFGPEVLVLTSSHDLGPSFWRAGEGIPTYAAVTIGDGHRSVLVRRSSPV